MAPSGDVSHVSNWWSCCCRSVLQSLCFAKCRHAVSKRYKVTEGGIVVENAMKKKKAKVCWRDSCLLPQVEEHDSGIGLAKDRWTWLWGESVSVSEKMERWVGVGSESENSKLQVTSDLSSLSQHSKLACSFTVQSLLSSPTTSFLLQTQDLRITQLLPLKYRKEGEHALILSSKKIYFICKGSSEVICGVQILFIISSQWVLNCEVILCTLPRSLLCAKIPLKLQEVMHVTFCQGSKKKNNGIDQFMGKNFNLYKVTAFITFLFWTLFPHLNEGRMILTWTGRVLLEHWCHVLCIKKKKIDNL